jgi:hypothetical protein
MTLPRLPVILIAALTLPIASDESPRPLWSQDFESIEVGQEPPGVLVQDGVFTVQAEGSNQVLELAGQPLGSMGIWFGPAHSSDISISGRVLGTRRGRSYPSFGLGLGGNQGYRLIVAPMRDVVEITQGDTTVKSIPFKWKSGSWTRMKLVVVGSGDGEWQVQGKVWPQDSPEPSGWTVEVTAPQEPPSGKASLWGMPYSGLPIRYDDVVYEKAG